MLSFIVTNFRWIAGGFLLTYCSTFGQTYFISASIGDWQMLFDLSHGEIGRLYMLATLGSAATLPFLGKLADTVSAHRLVLFCMPMLALAALLAGTANSPTTLLFAIYLLRLFGQGMMTHIALTMTGRWFVAGRGRAVSLVVLGHQGGEATLLLAFVTLSEQHGLTAGWYSAIAALLIAGLPMTYLCYRAPREPRSADAEVVALHTARRQWTRAEVIRDPAFYGVLAGVLAPAFIGTTIFYHQDYMTALNQWPADWFARCLVVLAISTVICALIFGSVIDRLGAIRVLPFFLIPLTAACFAMAATDTPESLIVVMVLVGISYGISSTLFGALWPEVYGTEHLGAIRSLVMAAMVFSTAAGPGVTGTFIDLGVPLPSQMYGMAVYCILVSAVLALAAAQLSRRSKRGHPAPAAQGEICE
ncbi:MAG: MFS transporter [Pseudomonadota bacterium]